MPLREFFSLLENSDGAARWVPYLSQQNDNLRQHLPELLQDIQPSLAIADAVFAPSSDVDYLSSGCGLEAVNLWIGDHRSVSSIHKDHYENMYAVVSGEKTFTLLPPTDVAHIGRYVKEYPTLRYAVKQHSSRGGQEDSHRHSSGASVSGSSSGPEDKDLELRADGCPSERLEWLPLDPEDPEVSSRYPAFRRTSPLRVTVRAGEVLYIPAMWYHRVSQTCLTIAVNYWYDQRFDFR
jgi:jumonji domain-containing protein 7